MNLEVLRELLDYRNTLQSLIWVDEQSINPTSLIEGHWQVEPSAGDIETNPLIILSWVCNKLTELVVLGKYLNFQFFLMKLYNYLNCKYKIILGYLIEPVDVCGIARLRGSNLKVYELLEEDICFNRPQSVMIYDEVVSVSTFI